jgi:hypothetical protein
VRYRNSWRSSVALALTGVLLATTGTPAQADPVEWTMASCVTVDATATELSGERAAGYFILLGSVTQCDPVAAKGGFRLGTYPATASTGEAPGYNVRLFSSAVAGSVRRYGAYAVPQTAGTYGLCVLAGELQRVDCLKAVVTGSGTIATMVVTPLETNSPLVDKTVTTTPYTGSIAPPRPKGSTSPTDPACGTCF